VLGALAAVMGQDATSVNERSTYRMLPEYDPILPPPGPGSEHAYVSALLEHFDCDVGKTFGHVMSLSNKLVVDGGEGGLTPMDKGGLGAQLCKCTVLFEDCGALSSNLVLLHLRCHNRSPMDTALN
jgi:hypothetical protein